MFEVNVSCNMTPLRKFSFNDFNVPCEELATKLLGKCLVRKISDKMIKGRIVETECYLGGDDKASHSYRGKRTERNEPMYMAPGTCYVYMTYGMYHCFNISSRGEGAAVLVRAVQPVLGVDLIRENRRNFKPPKNGISKQFKDHELSNGPAKVCIAFQIDKECNKKDLCTWDGMWIEDCPEASEHFTITSSRIGIDSVGKEWASAPLRFYEYNNQHVSKRDKKAEQIKFPSLIKSSNTKSASKRKLIDN